MRFPTGIEFGGQEPKHGRQAPVARRNAHAAPVTARSSDSTRSCLINRPRLAPMAARTANSCAREVPRANSRMDTFAHASRSSNIDAAKIKTRIGTNSAALSSSTKLRTSGRTSFGKRRGVSLANSSKSG